MSYPLGVSDKDFEDDSHAVEQAEEELNIRYRLIVETEDGEELFNEDYFSLSSLEESGLRKADHAATQAVGERVDLNRSIGENPDND